MDTAQHISKPAIPADLTFKGMFADWRKKRRLISNARKNVREKQRACRRFPGEEALEFDLGLAEDCLDYLKRL